MARIVCKKKGSSMFIEMSGEASLQNAAKAKDFFLSLSSGDCAECHINIAGITEIDLPFVELLISFRKTMERGRKNVLFQPLPPGHHLAAFLSVTGISYALLGGMEAEHGI